MLAGGVDSKRGVFGVAGGELGQVGLNRLVRTSWQVVKWSSGQVEELKHIGQAEMQPGDVFEIHTSGDGGFGEINSQIGR